MSAILTAGAGTHGTSIPAAVDPAAVDVGVAGSISAAAQGALVQAAAPAGTSVDQLAADLEFQGWG